MELEDGGKVGAGHWLGGCGNEGFREGTAAGKGQKPQANSETKTQETFESTQAGSPLLSPLASFFFGASSWPLVKDDVPSPHPPNVRPGDFGNATESMMEGR